jgi:hypothetical protein
MSKWLDKADEIGEHLKGLPELEGMAITVNRVEDLLNQVNQSVEKSAGPGVVIIKWLGGKNAEPKSTKLRMGSRYSVSLWMVQVLESHERTPDDLIELMAESLHGWDGGPVCNSARRLEVESVALVPDAPGYLVYEIIASINRLA